MFGFHGNFQLSGQPMFFADTLVFNND